MKIIYLLLIMLTTQLVHSKVLPVAHRGASAYAPENTLSAIKKASELGAKFIEIDVHMTKDGEVVALHDSTIDRTSDGTGKINTFTLQQLKEMDFGKWFSHDFTGEKIPTLLEVLNLLDEEQIVIIELKYGHDTYPMMEQKIVNLINETKKESQVILKSFDMEILQQFKKIAPEIDRLYCTFWGNDWFTVDNFFRLRGILKDADYQYLQVHKYFLSESLIKKAQAKGIKVVVWDVHDTQSMNEFVKMGVDFIETDNPDYVLSL